MVAELLCVTGQSLRELVAARMAAYPASGEINSTLTDAQAAIARVRKVFEKDAVLVDETDGISLSLLTGGLI